MRQPKPFFRKQTRSWYVQVGKRQINLGRHEEEAWAKYHELMASKVDLTSATATVAQLLDTYLEWCSKRRSKGTFENSKLYCRSFIRSVGKRIRIKQLKPKHISEWIDQHPKWTDNSKNDAISIVQRAFNWAVKQGYIHQSPIAAVEDKPRKRRREVVFSPAEFKEILGHVRDQVFKDFLEFLWETGCRPFEARMIEAEHVDLPNRMVVLPESLNKTGKGVRVIFLTDKASEILRRLLETLEDEGPLFRNSRGNPWTKDAIKCRLTRIRDKLGVDSVCAYGIRHSFATEGLKNGVDPLSLSMLMGHSDVSMIARTYQHLAKDPAFLRAQAEKAKGA